MAFVVEDGSSKTDSNSYLSEADLQTYWADHGDPASISGGESSDLEEALRMSTQYIDLVYGTLAKGNRSDADQALLWPRYPINDDGELICDSDEIHQNLKDACAEGAYRHIDETNGLLPDISEPGTIKKELIKVGPITDMTEYENSKSQIKRFRIMDLLMDRLINFQGGVERA